MGDVIVRQNTRVHQLFHHELVASPTMQQAIRDIESARLGLLCHSSRVAMIAEC